MHATHPFEALVAGLPQATVTVPMADYGQGCAFTPHYQFRYDGDKVQVGFAARFDRWANSVDFECQPVPEKEDVFNAFIAVLDRARKEQWKPQREFESIDLWPHVRKQRRETAGAERLAARRLQQSKR